MFSWIIYHFLFILLNGSFYYGYLCKFIYKDNNLK